MICEVLQVLGAVLPGVPLSQLIEEIVIYEGMMINVNQSGKQLYTIRTYSFATMKVRKYECMLCVYILCV